MNDQGEIQFLKIGQDDSDKIWCVWSRLYDAPIPIPRHKLVFRTLRQGETGPPRVTCTFSVHVSTHTDTKTRVFRRSNRSPTATKTLAVTLDSTFPFRPLLLVDPWRSRISFHPRERYQGNVSTHVKTVRALISGFIQNSLRKIFKSLDVSRIVRIIRLINFLDLRFLNFFLNRSLRSFFSKSSSVSLNASLI